MGLPMKPTNRVGIVRRLSWLFVVVSLGLFPVLLFAQDALANLASRIAEKRSQVETLSNELELTKTEYNEQLRSLATQQADLETQINRERMRLQQIEQDLEKARSRIDTNRATIEDVRPLVARVLADTRSYIASGLPFKVDERLAEVDTLERLLAEGNLESENTLARVWNLVESEFRLTAESGLYRQTIVVDGRSQLSEVARLGMVLLYFRTFDGSYGYAVSQESEWRYRVAEDRDTEARIATLFDMLRRNLREGFFQLPNPMSRG